MSVNVDKSRCDQGTICVDLTSPYSRHFAHLNNQSVFDRYIRRERLLTGSINNRPGSNDHIVLSHMPTPLLLLLPMFYHRCRRENAPPLIGSPQLSHCAKVYFLQSHCLAQTIIGVNHHGHQNRKILPYAPEVIWNIVGEPGRVDWVPGVESAEFDGDVRRFKMAGAGGLAERINKRDEGRMYLEYSVIESTPPLQSHVASIALKHMKKALCSLGKLTLNLLRLSPLLPRE